MSEYVRPASALVASMLLAAAFAWSQTSPRDDSATERQQSRTEQVQRDEAGVDRSRAETREQRRQERKQDKKEVAGPETVELLSKIFHTNEAEITLGELAEKNGQSEQVRRYGTVLAQDHRLANRRIVAVAEKLNVTFTAITAESEDQAVMRRLRTLKGAEFDREFLKAMHDGHQKAISLHENGRDSQVPAVRELIAKVLPILRQHDEVSMNLQKTGKLEKGSRESERREQGGSHG